MKNSLLSFFRRHPIYVLAILLLLFAFAWLLKMTFPYGRSSMTRSVCVVEGDARLYLHSDTSFILLDNVSVTQQGVWVNRWWAFPSCRGRILTVVPAFQFLSGGSRTNSGKNLSRLVKRHLDSLKLVLRRKTIEKKELTYYLRTHGVQDEGYGQIAQYATQQQLKVDSLQRLCVALNRALAGKHLSLQIRADYRARWMNNKKHWQQAALQTFIGRQSSSGQVVALRTRGHRTPMGVRPACIFPWATLHDKKVLTVSLMPTDSVGQYRSIIAKGSLKKRYLDIPQVFRRQGGAVYTTRGHLIGVIDQKTVRK